MANNPRATMSPFQVPRQAADSGPDLFVPPTDLSGILVMITRDIPDEKKLTEWRRNSPELSCPTLGPRPGRWKQNRVEVFWVRVRYGVTSCHVGVTLAVKADLGNLNMLLADGALVKLWQAERPDSGWIEHFTFIIMYVCLEKGSVRRICSNYV
ncbi:uncharacterized protein LOC106012009 [Aplysia californica]|uniref:Uncharacterized protein LOC106012009 n=1 Tax=Aplysia californica TaxID=6500 RepID=A0ABM1VUQ0_APLCA|nr:uncharacterized protein LOC106012009 [Aplysia californica]